ncbi:MAG TPA: MarR family transcriptional regulator [Baekduia sp.]|nr:MarR family transcriptional regulator [Baekduia sp.]
MPGTTSTSTSIDTAIEALVRQLYGLGTIRREIGRHAHDELGSQGFTALAVTYVHGPLRVSEVAEHLGVDLSVASRQIAALAAQGHVERHADERDRRAQLVAITETGRHALEEAHRRMVDAFARALAGWTAEDVAALTDGLERLRAAFTEAGAPHPTPHPSTDHEDPTR